MAELATIARPYAEALFRVAQAGDLAAWSDLVSEMAALAALPEIRELAGNPKVSESQIAETFLSLLKSKVTAEARNLVQMLVQNGRLTLMPEIGAQFHALKNAAEGAADAEISSAFPLEGAELAQLLATLEKKFGRKLNPAVTVDPSLIGGVRIAVGDEVLDTSVRARLQQMHATLVA